MEVLPTVEHHEHATRTDVELLGVALRAEMAEQGAVPRAEMAEMSLLRGDVRDDIAQMTRMLVTVVVPIAAVLASTAGPGVYLGG